MGRYKQPLALLEAKGKSHKTLAEKAERRAQEVKPITEGIKAPEQLSEAQKERFDAIAQMLSEWKVLSATDCEALARYVITVEEYWACTKMLKKKEIRQDIDIYSKWAAQLDKWDKACGRLEAKLGLTPVDRVRLSAPIKKEEPKVNRFAQFSVTTKASGDE